MVCELPTTKQTYQSKQTEKKRKNIDLSQAGWAIVDWNKEGSKNFKGGGDVHVGFVTILVTVTYLGVPCG